MESRENENGAILADEMPINPENQNERFQFSDEERIRRQNDFVIKIITKKYRVENIEGDGNCLFRSVAFFIYKSQDRHQDVRKECCNEMSTNAKFYTPFCVDENMGMQMDINKYIKTIRGNGVWEGELALRAMAKCYKKPIEVLTVTKSGFNLTIYPCEEAHMHDEPIRLIFNSDHYNAVVNSPSLAKSKPASEVKTSQPPKKIPRMRDGAEVTPVRSSNYDYPNSDLSLTANESTRRKRETHIYESKKVGSERQRLLPSESIEMTDFSRNGDSSDVESGTFYSALSQQDDNGYKIDDFTWHNKRTIIFDGIPNKVYYYFDYADFQIDQFYIELREIREKNDKLKFLTHPYILNFINEELFRKIIIFIVELLVHISLIGFLMAHMYMTTFQYSFWFTIVFSLLTIIMIIKLLLWWPKFHKRRLFKNVITFIWIFVNFLAFYSVLSISIVQAVSNVEYQNVSHFFKPDEVEMLPKNNFVWYSPVMVMLCACGNFLYLCGKFQWGIYIYMYWAIFKNVMKLTFIIIPTLITFSYIFYWTLNDTNISPWNGKTKNDNETIIHTFGHTFFQSIGKTAAMLIGELDASTLLSVNYIVVTILMLVFITIAITLLFNLTTAIAIPEVAYLRENAHKTLFKAKVDFLMNWTILTKECCRGFRTFNCPLNAWRRTINNVLVVYNTGYYYSFHDPNITITEDQFSQKNKRNVPTRLIDHGENDTRFRCEKCGALNNDSAYPEIRRVIVDGSKTTDPYPKTKNWNYYYQKFSRHLLGLDLKKYLDNFKE